MPNPMQYIISSEDEYVEHNIEQKIKEITSQSTINANEIKGKIDALPDTLNIKLLKNSVHLLHKNDLLTKESLNLIANKQSFSNAYFTNGIFEILDKVGLINQENLVWILNGQANVLFWDISVLHENDRLTTQNLSALKDEAVSKNLSNCLEFSLLPDRLTPIAPQRAKMPKNFISDCSNTFFNFRVNPLTARLPASFENSYDLNYRSTIQNNFVLANLLFSFASSFFLGCNNIIAASNGITDSGINDIIGNNSTKNINKNFNHRMIYEKLAGLENRLDIALKKFGEISLEDHENITSSIKSPLSP